MKRTTSANFLTAFGNWKQEMGDCDIEAIDRRMVMKWNAALSRSNLSANTANTYMRIIRAAYNKAVDELCIEAPNPWKRALIGQQETVKRALDSLSLRRLAAMKPGKKKQAWAKDVFMLLFMLRGMPPRDLWDLSPRDVQGDCIIYRRAKTGTLVRLKLEPEAKELLKRLGFAQKRARPFLPEYRKANYHLRKVGTALGLTFPLTLYCARHSWATAAQREGMPTSAISQCLGHHDEKTTRTYLAGLETPAIDGWGRRVLDSVLPSG